MNITITVVDQRLYDIEEAYIDRDFETFGKITMQDSNQVIIIIIIIIIIVKFCLNIC